MTVVGNSVCWILLIDPNGHSFATGQVRALPPGYDAAVNGAPVACEAGPCGTAASLKEQVIVSDLVSDTAVGRTRMADSGLGTRPQVGVVDTDCLLDWQGVGHVRDLPA